MYVCEWVWVDVLICSSVCMCIWVGVCVCVCVCVRLKVNTSNEQYFHKQHGEIRDDCFSLSSSVFIILASMNMYDFGNLKQKSV